MYECIIDGERIVVDDEDAHLLAQRKVKWRYSNVRSKNSNRAPKRYVMWRTTKDGKCRLLYLHHAILGKPEPGYVVDHIDGDTRNNTRSNLRILSHAENCQNRTAASIRSQSGLLGVHLHKASGLWTAAVTVNKKPIHVGYFRTPEEASVAYWKKKLEVHHAARAPA